MPSCQKAVRLLCDGLSLHLKHYQVIGDWLKNAWKILRHKRRILTDIAICSVFSVLSAGTIVDARLKKDNVFSIMPTGFRAGRGMYATRRGSANLTCTRMASGIPATSNMPKLAVAVYRAARSGGNLMFVR